MSRLITVHNPDNEPIYDIVIERDFSKLAPCVAKLDTAGRKICIVTESHVGPLYAEAVKAELEKNGNPVFVFTFEAGEENKNRDTVYDLYEFLILNKFDRKDILAALGGGVTGDLTGFAAATYLRGISFIQIPTTLLAQADSSVGGKTGVDFKSYKNMIGAFHQPKLVYMNMSVHRTLDERQFNSGFGEVIKHGLIKDAAYYKWIRENVDAIKALDYDTLEYLISRNCEIKRDVVEKDPTEKGDRALLNFGHTLGHAIEKLMDFKLYHGECVCLGMRAALELCRMRGLITYDEVKDAADMMKLFAFPEKVSGITAQEVVDVSKSDKKMDAGRIKFVLLDRIGNAFLDMTLSDDEMLAALKAVIE